MPSVGRLKHTFIYSLITILNNWFALPPCSGPAHSWMRGRDNGNKKPYKWKALYLF